MLTDRIEAPAAAGRASDVNRYDESEESVRLGGVLNLSYQFTPANKLAWPNFVSRDTDDNARYYEGHYEDFDIDIRNQRLRFIERTIFNSQLAGEHFFKGLANSVMIWTMSYSSATRHEPDLRESLQIYLPRLDEFVFFDDSQSAFRMFNELDETILNPGVDLLVPFYKGTLSGAVKFGANYSSRGRNFRSRRFKYVLRGSRGLDRTLPPNELFADEHIGPRLFEIDETTRVTDAYRGGAGRVRLLRDARAESRFKMESDRRPASRGRQPGCHDVQSVPAGDRARTRAVQYSQLLAGPECDLRCDAEAESARRV